MLHSEYQFERVAPGYWIYEDRLGAVELWRDGRRWWIGVADNDGEVECYLEKAAGPFPSLTKAYNEASECWCLKG